MKRLYLLRHAKSSWEDPQLNDLERPLNQRGRRDSPVMSARLADYFAQHALSVQKVLSSPALRAQHYAKDLAKALAVSLEINEQLYTFTYATLCHALSQLPNTLNGVVVVAHNPAVTDFVNQFGADQIGNLPTSGWCVFRLTIDNWASLTPGPHDCVYFDYPKNNKLTTL